MGLVQRTMRKFIASLVVGTVVVTPGIATAQKAAKKDPVSVRLPGVAFAAMQTIDPEHRIWIEARRG